MSSLRGCPKHMVPGEMIVWCLAFVPKPAGRQIRDEDSLLSNHFSQGHGIISSYNFC